MLCDPYMRTCICVCVCVWFCECISGSVGVCRRPSVGQAHWAYCVCGAQVTFPPPVTGDFTRPHQEASGSTGRNMWSGGQERRGEDEGNKLLRKCLRGNTTEKVTSRLFIQPLIKTAQRASQAHRRLETKTAPQVSKNTLSEKHSNGKNLKT